MEQIDELKQLLPKYDIVFNTNYRNNISITYSKYNLYREINPLHIPENIILYKFMHDNLEYFIEMLLLNGFVRYNERSDFNLDDLYIHLHIDIILVQNFKTGKICAFENPETMSDDLREFIGVSHKIVLTKNE